MVWTFLFLEAPLAPPRVCPLPWIGWSAGGELAGVRASTDGCPIKGAVTSFLFLHPCLVSCARKQHPKQTLSLSAGTRADDTRGHEDGAHHTRTLRRQGRHGFPHGRRPRGRGLRPRYLRSARRPFEVKESSRGFQEQGQTWFEHVNKLM